MDYETYKTELQIRTNNAGKHPTRPSKTLHRQTNPFPYLSTGVTARLGPSEPAVTFAPGEQKTHCPAYVSCGDVKRNEKIRGSRTRGDSFEQKKKEKLSNTKFKNNDYC